MGLTQEQMASLKDIIQAERERVLNQFSNDHDELVIKDADGKDDVDQASAEYERARMLRFKKRDQFYAKKLTKSLEKMTLNEYGTCEECDEVIRFDRLKARPTAELCITCKDEAEKEECGNFAGRQSKSFTKSVSLN